MLDTLPLETLASAMLACGDYANADAINVSTTIGNENFRDAVICSYTIKQGLTLPGFAAIVLVGVVNLPIYIRQESALIPFVLTLILGGVLLDSATGFVQGMGTLLVLLLFGLGPVLLLRRVDRT